MKRGTELFSIRVQDRDTQVLLITSTVNERRQRPAAQTENTQRELHKFYYTQNTENKVESMHRITVARPAQPPLLGVLMVVVESNNNIRGQANLSCC